MFADSFERHAADGEDIGCHERYCGEGEDRVEGDAASEIDEGESCRERDAEEDGVDGYSVARRDTADPGGEGETIVATVVPSTMNGYNVE